MFYHLLYLYSNQNSTKINFQQSILIGSIMALGLGGLAALYNYGLQDQIAQKATANSVCRTVSGISASFSKRFFLVVFMSFK